MNKLIYNLKEAYGASFNPYRTDTEILNQLRIELNKIISHGESLQILEYSKKCARQEVQEVNKEHAQDTQDAGN